MKKASYNRAMAGSTWRVAAVTTVLIAVSAAQDAASSPERSIALVLVVDRSGSMDASVGDGKARIDYARTAVSETATQLREGDHLGVVSFGKGATEVVKLGPVPDSASLDEHLSQLVSRPEGTQLEDGLDLARRILSKSKLDMRHVVVITDAEFLRSELHRYQIRARRMATEGITVSMVHLPDNPLLPRDPQVARIAAFGKGRYIKVTDPSAVPRHVLTELQRVSGIQVKQKPDPLAKIGSEKKTHRAIAQAPKPQPANPMEQIRLRLLGKLVGQLVGAKPSIDPEEMAKKIDQLETEVFKMAVAMQTTNLALSKLAKDLKNHPAPKPAGLGDIQKQLDALRESVLAITKHIDSMETRLKKAERK